jgi:hypothetical protein
MDAADVSSKSASKPRMILRFGGGLNENSDPNPDECSMGYNFDLDVNNASFKARLPIDVYGTAPNGGSINAILQLVKRDNTDTTLVNASDKIYLWDGSSGFTLKTTITDGAKLRSAYWSLGDYLVISDVNLKNPVLKWDGTTCSVMPTGLGHPFYAKYAICHANRIWYFNIVDNATAYPHMIVASAFEDPTTLDATVRGGPTSQGGSGGLSTGLEAFFLLSPDLRPINGVCFFKSTLIISTVDGKLFQLTGTKSTDFEFTDFFDMEPAIGDESLLPIGNDVLYFRRGGRLSLMFATQDYGDVNIADVSNWIPNTVSQVATVNSMVYDVLTQRALLFIPGKVLVLFKNILSQERYSLKTAISPWSVYTTQDASNFDTNHATYIRHPGGSDYTVFFGDASGRILDMDGEQADDGGTQPIIAYRRSRHIGTEILNPWPWMEENITGHLRYLRNAATECSLLIEWDDEYNTSQMNLTLKGPAANDTTTPYFGGNFYFNRSSYFNQGFEFAQRQSSLNLSPGGKGPGFYIGLYLASDNPFEIRSVEFD